ncbi:hypothetical protein BV20DRAFT_122720 [Pilatotrama ljubarskyi]|nr:hypothetical protein BV20DRAFT_122720 [Pilatotrama ljubarskyi]
MLKRIRAADSTDKSSEDIPEELVPAPKRANSKTTGVNDQFVAGGYRQSPDFWYPDGNIILVFGDVGYKLVASRLSRYFTSLPLPHPDCGDNDVDDCKTLSVPNIAPEKFEKLLRYVELPFEYSINTAPRDTVLEIVRTSKLLGCSRALQQALVRIGDLTHSEGPPGPDAWSFCDNYKAAIEMIHLAREHDVPSILKPAFYELLRDDKFWRVVKHKGPDAVQLPPNDIVRLYTAHAELGTEWRELCLIPPSSRHWSSACTCRISQEPPARQHAWRKMLPDDVLEESDPINSSGDLHALLVRDPKDWCKSCLKIQQDRWNNARGRWWHELDQWLGLSPRPAASTSKVRARRA